VTPGAVAARGDAIAAGFVASYTLGSGQFCTKPGLLFLPTGHGLGDVVAEHLRAASIGPLLNARIHDGFTRTVADLARAPGVRTLVEPSTVESDGYAVSPVLLAVAATDVVAHGEELLAECFGPAALVIEYSSPAELSAALAAVPGSLTATLHADPAADGELV